uniref:Uncharacterized protein n=1 Tax=Gossypium raimondii TaxID=29730 RepID=A0A0D2RPE9_GOSRA|nr:hypothetical protein B456_011G184300 [Gossypium raimondii]KJB72548.1 hypothetical protein B456_011G184300 [Gossypium raimondii]KJB72549.1 hypothetical protein B456_011G184300 [Gossypium raimondii]
MPNRFMAFKRNFGLGLPDQPIKRNPPLNALIPPSLILQQKRFYPLGISPKSRLGFLSHDSYGSVSCLSLNYLPKLQPLNRLGIGTEIPMIFPQIQTFLFCCLPERRVWSSSPPTSRGQSLQVRPPCSPVISPPMNPLPSPNQR